MDIANRQQQFLLAHRSYADKSALEATGYTLPSRSRQSLHVDHGARSRASARQAQFRDHVHPTGSQASDGAITLDSQGRKAPAEKWSR